MLKLDARTSKFFAAKSLCLSALHNYYNAPTKLFADLYLAKFVDISAKSSFPYNNAKKKYIDPKFPRAPFSLDLTSHSNCDGECFRGIGELLMKGPLTRISFGTIDFPRASRASRMCCTCVSRPINVYDL